MNDWIIRPQLRHLTRDDRDAPYTGGGKPRDNFLSILDERRIPAVQPHCLHGKKVRGLRKDLRDKFKIACFTEVPLSQVRHLIVDPTQNPP